MNSNVRATSEGLVLTIPTCGNARVNPVLALKGTAAGRVLTDRCADTPRCVLDGRVFASYHLNEAAAGRTFLDTASEWGNPEVSNMDMYRRHLSSRGRIAAASALFAISTMLAPFAAPAHAAARVPTFRFEGAGWGHGIGLSQWGAKGFAERGKTWDWIATYYFPGSRLTRVPDRTVRVNLDAGKQPRRSWTLAPASADARVRIGSSLGARGQAYTFTSAGSSIVVTGGKARLTLPASATSPLVVSSKGGPALVRAVDKAGMYGSANRVFRGAMELRPIGARVGLANALPLEDYIKGVLPGEVNSKWDIDAVAAQAVAARSYAVVSRGELWCTTQSQVYLGYSYENDVFRKAVDMTAGTVLTHRNRVIQAYFHSSSGGHTVNIEDAWTRSATPSKVAPYFRGVVDPYDGGSPNSRWSLPMDGRTMAAKLGASAKIPAPAGAGKSIWVAALSPNSVPSGHVKTVDITWTDGRTSTTTRGVAGSDMRVALGLKSTRFWFAEPVPVKKAVKAAATPVKTAAKVTPVKVAPKASPAPIGRRARRAAVAAGPSAQELALEMMLGKLARDEYDPTWRRMF